ncbi:DoxX family protein [Nonomuraea sp. NPDC059194]|uniref:DoxX family protein n=1 Tax=Nonomuraea sp. NPDC059194 TaxID=3346764 RepID=UPI0036C47209
MKQGAFDLAALVARVVIGVIFVAHGWQKWQSGLGAVTGMFTKMGVPLPELSATFAAAAELVGGAFLIIGALVRLAALALFADMVGALVFVHAGKGVFVSEGGWELVGALAAGCLLLMALGGGRFGVDGLFVRSSRKKAERREAERADERAPMDIFDEPRRDEDLPRRDEDLPQRGEDLPRRDQDLPRRGDDLPPDAPTRPQ